MRGEHNSGDLGTIVDRDGRHHKWKDTKNIPARTKKLQVLFRIVSQRRIHLYAPYGTFEATDYLTAIQFASTDRDIDDYAILKILDYYTGLETSNFYRQYNHLRTSCNFVLRTILRTRRCQLIPFH